MAPGLACSDSVHTACPWNNRHDITPGTRIMTQIPTAFAELKVYYYR